MNEEYARRQVAVSDPAPFPDASSRGRAYGKGVHRCTDCAVSMASLSQAGHVKPLRICPTSTIRVHTRRRKFASMSGVFDKPRLRDNAAEHIMDEIELPRTKKRVLASKP